MINSKHFMMFEVRATGRTSFFSLGFDLYRTGVMQDVFHAEGIECLSREAEKVYTGVQLTDCSTSDCYYEKS